MKFDREFDKRVDLHESEWRYANKSEPFFGHGAAWFFKVTIPTAAIALCAGYAFSWLLTAVTGYSLHH
ncbi:MAG: hypothetical protein QMD99_13840 [Rhizobiaceae bacterium]|nr:hypothetical protein [Rhizobiaceae bacterium]